MAKWTNRTVVAAPRNGTTSHTVAFTPAAVGSLLVAVIEGAVTSTTPTGWTLPAGGAAVNNTGLYVWWKTATASESSFTTTHNGSDYPVVAAVYEFPAGSTFVAAASATGQSVGTSTGPTLSGLTGTNQLFGVAANVCANTTVPTYSWTAPAGILEDVDQGTAKTTTDGYAMSVANVADSTAATFAGTSTATGAALSGEALSFAVKAAATTANAVMVARVTAAATTTPGTATLTGTGTLTGNSRPATQGTATLTGAGTAAGTGWPSTQGAASLTGSGAASSTWSPQAVGVVSLSGDGTLTGSGSPQTVGALTLTGSGQLTATGSAVQASAGSVALTGTGVLTTVGTPNIYATSALTGAGALTAVSQPAAATPTQRWPARTSMQPITASLTAAGTTSELRMTSVTPPHAASGA